jgi:2-iminobutanoate/2-iminopropanoate deaminase
MPEKIDVVCVGAPKAIGPYSQAIKYDQMIFLSGQIPVDPATGQLSAPDIEGQTRRALDNIKAILEITGGSMNSIVKTTVYLTSLLDFEMMNEVYARYFNFRPPARSTVEVAALPKGALIEIDAIAILPTVPDMGLKRKI